MKKVDSNYNCGFPNSAINKRISKLEENKISYMVVDKADNFAVLEEDYKSSNKYNEIYNKAHKHINRKNLKLQIW